MELLRELKILAVDGARHDARPGLAPHDSLAEIGRLVTALAKADRDTYRHSLEVAAMASAVARQFALGSDEMIDVELGALLHDVGKLRAPPELLSKPGRLTAQEERLIRLHPEWGAEMVAGIAGLDHVALIVRSHHERPDGLGYPYGLTHERIPLPVRIVSACDAYGAMTEWRPYRAALDVDVALGELTRHSGTQFDADVVDVVTSVVRVPHGILA
jgi:putative nucleotidyltransferase with HDIG domain